MRVLVFASALLFQLPAFAADLIGGGQAVLGIQQLDETRVKITIQGDKAADTHVVDCIAATWGFDGGNLQQIQPDQRSQAIAERACRGLEFKSARVMTAGTWRSETQVAEDAPPRRTWPVSSHVSSPQPWDQFPQNIFSDYTLEQYPKTFAQWGAAGVEQIALLERMAAVHVSKSRLCSRVEYVGLSETRSVPPAKAVVFVDCANGYRFHVGESELQASPDSLEFKRTW